jgi:DNA end-binding protein Ku
MPARSSWKGYLKISLVSVPVKAYTATSSDGGRIALNQLHEECHSRIRYQKVCPIHGEVGNDEIVSGFEYAKGQYVVIDPEELDKLRTESDRSINVDAFVHADAIDPIYLSGKTYYLVPEGPVGQKPYALIRQCMADENVHAVAQVVISGREQLVLLRPAEDLIAMSVLSYEGQVKKPSAFEDELVETETSDRELKLTRQLIEALVEEKFDIGRYSDTYTEKLAKVIEAKVAGKELVSPPPEEEPQVINLMQALKESVQRIQTPRKKKPSRKMAASKARRTPKKAKVVATRRKRKSG